MSDPTAEARNPRNSGLCPWAGIHLLSEFARLPILAGATAAAHLLSRPERCLRPTLTATSGRPRSQARRWRKEGFRRTGYSAPLVAECGARAVASTVTDLHR